jgi:hypothetical protein
MTEEVFDYEWLIEQLHYASTENGLEQVIKTIDWRLRCTGQDGLSSDCYGTVGLASPNPDTFEVFAGLTKEQVTEWLVAALDGSQEGEAPYTETLKSGLRGNILKRRNPLVVNTSAMPWDS